MAPQNSKEDFEWSERVIEDFSEDISSLPAIDEPSGFDKRVGYAKALVNSGATMADAARAVGIEYNVLVPRLKRNAVVPGEVKEEQEAVIRDLAVEGLVKSSERIIGMIDGDEMKPAELIKANQTLRDTVSTLDKWKERGTGGGDKTSNALGALVNAVIKGDLVKAESTEEKVIDVDADVTE